MGVVAHELSRFRTSRFGMNATWMLVGQGASVVLQAAYFTILARMLNPSEYGVYVGAFAFTNLASQYSALGSGTIFLRYVSGHRKRFAVYWGNILVITLTVGGLLVVLLSLVGRFVINPESARLVGLAGVANCICAQLSVDTGRVFQAFERMRVTAILNMLTNLVRAVAAGAMLIFLPRVNAFQWSLMSTAVSALAAAAAIGCATMFFGRPRIWPIMFPKHGLEGLGHSIAGSTSSMYNDLDKTMLSHYGMNHANGIYTVAYRVIDIATIPVFSVRDAAMPKFFVCGRAGVASTALLAGRLMKRTVPIGAVLALSAFLIAPLLPHILGRNFQDSVAALRWLSLIPLFRSIHQIAGSALTGAGMQRYRTSSQLGAAGLNFALNLYLIPSFGWLGAAWASLATDATLAAVNVAALQCCIRRSVPR